MSYPPPLDATVVRRADQPLPGDDPNARVRFVATGAQTHNDFGLFEYRVEPGDTGALPHYHPGFSETFYVLEGRLAVLSEAGWTTVGSGDLVYVPRHGLHAFRPPDDQTSARFLILFTPGIPREEYFAATSALRASGRVPTPEELDELAGRFGQVNVRDRG